MRVQENILTVTDMKVVFNNSDDIKTVLQLKLSFKKVESRVEQKGHFFTVPGQLVTTTESIGEVSPSSAR